MDKEALLFELYKDTTETSNEKKRAVLKAKYPDVDISGLHIKIIKYQVKKYGASLINTRPTVEDYKIRATRAKNRRRRRIGK